MRHSIALGLLLAVLGAQPAAADVLVGKSGRVAVGVVSDGNAVRAYVCDGRTLSKWFTTKRGEPRLGKGLTIARGSGGRVEALVEAAGTTRTVALQAARGRAGLYRAESRRGGKRSLAGWVVANSGKQTGVVVTAGAARPAPTLSTTTLVAGAFVAGRVIPPAGTQLVLIDSDGDGVDLSRRVSTALVGGGVRTVDWPAAGSDDAFVALDADVLRSLGYRLTTRGGSVLAGAVLVRDGLVVTGPNGLATSAVSGYDALTALDGNHDGHLAPADPAYAAVRRFRDLNGDGAMQAGELRDKLGTADELSQDLALDLQAAVVRQSQAFLLTSQLLAAQNRAVATVVAAFVG